MNRSAPNTLAALIFMALSLGSTQLWAQSGIEGLWDFKMSSPFGEVTAEVDLYVDGSNLIGQFDLGDGRVWPIKEGSVQGNEISFSITRDGPSGDVTYEMTATIMGDTAEGTAIGYGSESSWTMTRVEW